MNESHDNRAQDVELPRHNQNPPNILVQGTRYILPVIALVIGILITLHLLNTGPEAKPVAKKKNQVLVETKTVQLGSFPTFVQAMGAVKAKQTIELKPQVSGQIVSIGNQFMPGGRFIEGDLLLEIDPLDYQLTLRQQENTVIQAQNDIDLEEGNQLVVKREFDLLGEKVTEAEMKLMLRQPQLSSLKTKLEIAQAKKEQAGLNLARTRIKAPYNGIIQTREANIGTWVSTSTPIATLVGSDSYWVEVSVPEDQLQWISLPYSKDGQGSEAKIYNPTAWDQGTFRQGRVIQLLPGLETQGRMARLIVEIDDPLAMQPENDGKPQLLIDSFVRVVIEGKDIGKAAQVSREYLRNGNQLWVYDKEGNLDVRDVSIAFKNKNNVFITDGIGQGEELIISDISTPVAGMSLRQARIGYAEKNKETEVLVAQVSSGNTEKKEPENAK